MSNILTRTGRLKVIEQRLDTLEKLFVGIDLYVRMMEVLLINEKLITKEAFDSIRTKTLETINKPKIEKP